MKRYPVIYKKTVLSPCSKRRAYSLVRSGKAIFVQDKILGIYVKLKTKPSGFKTPKTALGIDTGTMYSCFSVVNQEQNLSFNLEVESSLRVQKKNNIVKKSEDRRNHRRIRRGRLRHREVRFKNRTGSKVTATENYYYQMFRNFAERLCKFYPITDIVIEDVAHVHNTENTGSGFSPLEQIKTRLYSKLSTLGNLWISKANPRKIRMFNFAEVRRISNSTVKDMDLKLTDIFQKSDKSFYAHGIDSHSLACLVFGKHLPFTEDLLYVSRYWVGLDKNRRILERERPSCYGSKRIQRKHSKFRKLRVKIDEFQGNHGPWNYLDADVTEHTESKKKCPYGSSIDFHTHQNKYPNYRYWNTEFIKGETENSKYYVRMSIDNEELEKLLPYCVTSSLT